jgi:hypothetical protein
MAFEIFTNVIVYLKDEIDTLLSGKSAVGHTHAHADTTGQTADQHHAQAHTLGSHSTRAHSELTDVGADDHHAQSHSHASHTGIGADDHHAQAHTLASHSTKAHSELSGIGTDDHHAQSHTLASHSTSTIPSLNISGGILTMSVVLTVSALNTWYELVGVAANSGIIRMRDNTLGGTAVVVHDPNGGNYLIVSQITGFAVADMQLTYDGTYHVSIRLTSGAVPRQIMWGLLAA